MLRQHMCVTRLLILLYVLVTIAVGCLAQIDNGISYIVHNESSGTVYRQMKTHTSELPDLIDDGQWISDDDASAHDGFSDRRALFVHKAIAPLPLQHRLLIGLAALFAMLCAGLFHDSTCQTRELMRIMSYIQAHDGIKGLLSFPR